MSGSYNLSEEDNRILVKGVKNTKFTLKTKHWAQQPENGVLVILWKEINPDCGNNLSVT